MAKTLFIGNFLSKSRGTLGPSEQIAKKLSSEGMPIITASSQENPLFRYLEMCLKSLFFDYRIIHIDVFSGRSFFLAETAAFLGKLRRKRVLLTLHGGMLPEFYKEKKIRVTKLFGKADQVFSPSKYIRNFFIKKNFLVSYLPNSIDLKKFPYKSIRPKSRSILWVRGFHEIYKPSLAILMMELIIKKYPDASLTMVGPDKGLKSFCKKLVKEKKLENFITMSGPVKNEELFRYLHAHAVFINTTLYESFGVAVLEAAATGIPIVSTAVGEIPLLWQDGKDIELVTENTPEAFTQKVSQIFDSKQLREHLSKNARKKAEQFDWEIIKERWLELLN